MISGDMEELPPLVPDSILKEQWAQPIKDLWQYLPFDFNAEKEFNERLASKPPYCAICSIFKPFTVSNCSGYVSSKSSSACVRFHLLFHLCAKSSWILHWFQVLKIVSSTIVLFILTTRHKLGSLWKIQILSC